MGLTAMGEFSWRTNLRGNLDLWPTVSTNIAALIAFNGKAYDESAMLLAIPKGAGEKAPTDGRAVRNTFEVLALAGLTYRDPSNSGPDIFRLTSLGEELFSFLGLAGAQKKFINVSNRRLAAEPMIRGLGIVPEYRAIWALMRQTENRLTNEELNRSLAQLKSSADISRVAELVLRGRAVNDPIVIGPRLYEDAKYGTAAANDQRKAMNPLFLLFGGGRLFITLDQSSDYRVLEPWSLDLIDEQIQSQDCSVSQSTDAEFAKAISAAAGAYG